MASTNQEPSSGNHNLTAQRQQQDLIKLLAQHFHHQFYQLASTNNGSQLLDRNHPLQASHLSYLNRAHYSTEAPLLRSGIYNDLNNLNLATNSNQMLHNQTIRSQQTNTSNDLSANTSSLSVAQQESLLDYSSQGAAGLYSMNDANLFNVLGLNLTNNQLVLSLQQAAAARQYELKTELEDQRHHHQHQQQQQEQQRSRQRKSNESINHSIGHEDDNNGDGAKEMLKFSINTILGRGSPRSSLGVKGSRPNLLDKASSSDTKLIGEQINDSLGLKNEKDELQQQYAVTECDAAESCSDSSSLNTSSTPIPQSSTSILFNQALPSDNCGVSNMHITNSSSAISNQHPLRHHTQPHHPHYHHSTLPMLPSSAAFPWTVAARGKPRRGMMRRAVFSDSQRVGLEKRFQLQKYISKPDRKKLAEKLGLRDSQVKIWFQNRRMKWRNSKERELLSAGGSREQTLPTRNNPNPDLSDVGETIRRLTTNSNNSTSNSTLNK